MILENEEARNILLDDDRDFVDAVTVARKDDYTKQWRNEVTEAAIALSKIGAIEVAALQADDISKLERLRDSANQVLNFYKLTQSQNAATGN